MPPVFGLPPRIQKMSRGKLASACSAESTLVALLSLTNSTRPAWPTSSMRCDETRKGLQPPRDDLRREAEREAGGGGRGGVLGVVRAAQRADARQIGDFPGYARLGDEELRALRIDAISDRLPLRDPPNRYTGLFDPVGDGGRQCVVYADHRGFGAIDQPLLDRGIVLHGAVPLQVILGEVQQHADGRIERRREIDLIGRALDDMDAGQ